jgi:dTDP-4-amino-4,6-dideoxygalactose transaminase
VTTRPPSRIPLARPLFGPEEVEAVAQVLASGWVMQGPRTAAFEERLAEICGARHAVACSSGTAALHLGLWALGIGPGDEVIVPALSFAATAHVVELCGARPVFVEVHPETWEVDVSACGPVVTSRTRALIPVHLFGRPIETEPLMGLGLPLLEDAAGALGSALPAGGLARAYSFHPRKIVTMGEGGVLTTDRDALAARARSLRNQGRAAVVGGASIGDYAGPGTNYRLTDLQAALGLCQLDRLPALLEARRGLVRRYRERLAGLPLELPPDHPGHSYQALVVLVKRRDAVLNALRDAGIEAAPGAHCIPALAYYRERYALDPARFPVALRVHDEGLALPLYPQMSEDDLDRVVRTLEAALRA